ncbi:MarR family winged helix-turn-helix transcriptional regulator [Planobispora longispora]|uniref:MarR family transcriptional regulator n=1 Tax=Planobispora longispora TaxID=28887 RepID=A0A8J3RIT9_9ACTN|nr:MarR family transcriptional regulator [Planobispora longispora]BFE84411.1 MarR family transcriptional regulator [Planobispora longispora]GIH75704.1 MarR family transcriptional regulator [Planobispora longispora]
MSEPRWLNETELRAWTGFLETSDLLHRMVEQQLREVGGVTTVQYDILHRLNESPEKRLCMTDLAERLVSSRSGITYQVAQLEKAGLLRREDAPDDERRVLAAITEKGRRVLETTAPGHVEAVRAGLLDSLTPDQVAQLAAIMDATRARLRDTVQLHPPRKARSR